MTERNVMNKNGTTMLERVENACVFGLGWNEEIGEFDLGEECDNYFSVTLTPEQLLMLADEIRAKALEKMPAKA